MMKSKTVGKPDLVRLYRCILNRFIAVGEEKMNGEAYEQAHLCGCGENIGDGTSIARFPAVKESLRHVGLDRKGTLHRTFESCSFRPLWVGLCSEN